VEGDRVRKRHATLEAWTSSPKNDDSALPAGLKPLLHNIPNSTIPDWRLHTAAESGDFGSTRVCPPRSQRFALSIYGALVSISQMLAHVQRTMRSSPRGRGACGAKLLPASQVGHSDVPCCGCHRLSLPTTLSTAMRFLFSVGVAGLSWVASCLADQQAFVNDDRYNKGDYGHFPHQTFFSRDGIESPRPNFMKPFTNCDDGSYLFVSLRGNFAESKPYILDPAGNLVWTFDHYVGEVYNLQVQEYKGKPYITYWAGDDSVGGHGAGKYYMLDEHYEEFKQITAANGLDADLHDFRITPNNTALITVYEIIEADLSSLNSSLVKGEIWDSLFQEIDLETGEAIFQWRASEHIDWDEAYLDINDQEDGVKGRPWDFYHINTVDKDPAGNYLVSGRFTRSIINVDGQTGEILWRLGGKRNDFKDLSKGAATTFAGQHDAQWTDSYSSITFFDNRADWFNQIDNKSAGVKITLNTSSALSKPTAELVQTFIHPSEILSTSQGSMQTLPSGNILLGYGFNGVVTEFSPSGTALCDAFFEASAYIGSGDVQSYRAYKNHWTGRPSAPPDIALHDGVFYISWLGATEVREWVLRSGFAEDDEWTDIAQFRKDGFETHYTLPENRRIKRWVKAFALGEDGEELGVSNALDVADQITMWYVHGPVEDAIEELEEGEEHESPADGYYSFAGIAVATFGLCGMLVLVLSLGCYAARTRSMGMSDDASSARAKSFVDEERAAFLGPDGVGEEMSSTSRGHTLEP
jgi:hypothetical protein